MELTAQESKNLAYLAEGQAREILATVTARSLSASETRSAMARANRWFDIADGIRAGLLSPSMERCGG